MGYDGVEGFRGSRYGFRSKFVFKQLVWEPLRHLPVPFTGEDEPAGMIQGFKGAHRGGAYRDDFRGRVVKRQPDFLQQRQRHGDKFGMHGMLPYGLRLDGLECASTDMQGQFAAWYPAMADFLKHTVCEVKTGRGGGHRTFHPRIDRLVVVAVGRLRRAVEIWRDGDFTDGIDYLGESHRRVVPREAHDRRVA